MKAIVGRKVRMTQIFLESGDVVPVTVVRAGPNVVVQRKTKATDGYEAVQVGFDPDRNPNKPAEGHFKSKKLQPTKILREFRVNADEKLDVGSEIKADVFAEGEIVNVTGITKGRGFTGGMKRWGWHGGKATHGSMSHRRIGSVGANTYPGRLWLGRTLPGHYGTERVTIRNLKVVKVDKDQNLLYIRGGIPGCISGVIIVQGVS